MANVYVATTSNSAFNIKKGDLLKVYKQEFRNGETHFIGIMNSKSVDLPSVFFLPSLLFSKKTHEVLKISVDGKFSQYLKKSEVRFITQICTHGTVTVELVMLTNSEYKTNFGL